jgi:hypothetical protein
VTTSTPRHDDGRDRPLRLAIRAARLLGLASGLFGLVFTFAFGYFNRYTTFRPYFIMMGLAVWLIPGVLLFTCAWLMDRQRSHRAAAGAMVIAAVDVLFALGMFAVQFRLTPISPIPLILCLMWAAAAVQLIGYLWRSLPLLEADPARVHGFEIAPQPILKAEPADAQPPTDSVRGK